jgi:hypothetical protein
MANYIAQRVIDGAQDYTNVISRRSDLKASIDTYLLEKGKEDLITQ